MEKRRKLKLKILGKYETLGHFAKVIGCSRQHLSNILRGRATGSIEFWKVAKEKLNLSNKELWEYQSLSEFEGNHE